MKKIKIFFAAICLFALTACNQVSEDKKVVSVAFQAAEGTVQYESAEYFKKIVEEKSQGKLEIRLYPSGQMGSDREIIETTQFGDISIISAANSPVVPFIKEFAVFDAPMLFSEYDPVDILKVFREGKFRDMLNEKCREKNLELLSLNCNNLYREMSSNVMINTIEDFKKIRIRTMDNKYHIEFWKRLGANPTPIAFSELYLSLQQGLIDAQENPYEVLLYTGIHEQQKYIIKTDHILFVTVFLMNKDQYDALTEEERQILRESSIEHEDYLNKLTNESIDSQVEKLTGKYKMEMVELPKEIKDEMLQRSKPVYGMISNDIGKEYIDTIISELEQLKN